MENLSPILVEVTRGARVESRHAGIAAIVDASGSLVGAWGDIDRPLFPRSSIKPLQAIPLIETGAAEAQRLSDRQIAVACASHRGMPIHTETAAAWLKDLDLSENDLVCGPQTPDHNGTAEALRKAGTPAGRIHNNCSGKHTGFLATARHMSEDPAEYHLVESPVQHRVREVLAEMSGNEVEAGDFGIDGCGVPNFAMSARAMAQAMARIADPAAQSPTRRSAIDRIYGAMTAEPDMVRGGRAFDSLAIGLGNGAFITKTGAEGVHVAALRGRGRSRGLGIAVKIEDGARRAADLAIAHLLRACGALDDEAEANLATYLEKPVLNSRDAPVGVVRIAEGWAAELGKL